MHRFDWTTPPLTAQTVLLIDLSLTGEILSFQSFGGQAAPGPSRPLGEYLSADHLSNLRGALRALENRDNPGSCWLEADFGDGARIWQLSFAALPPEARVARSVWVDITDTFESHRAMDRFRNQYRALFEDAPVMLHSIDRQGRLLSVSDVWLQKMGYTRDEVIGRLSVEFLTPDSRRDAKLILENFFQVGHCENITYQMVRKDGRIIDVLLSATAERDNAGQVLRSLAVILDVTDLRRSETAMQLAVRAAGLGVWSYDVIADHFERNESFLQILPSDSGTRRADFLELVYPMDRSSVEAALLGDPKYEDSYSIHYRIIRPDGELRHVLDQGVIKRNKRGEAVYLHGVCMDVTDQRLMQAELERVVWERTSELRALNEELESFCYSVSHDLRAPLRHIAGYIQLLKEELGEAHSHNIEVIEDSAARMGNLIDELLRFSRTGRQALRSEPLDMNSLVSETRARYFNTRPRNASGAISWAIEKLGEAWGDPALISQVWQNLIDNALKYSRSREHARIEIGCRSVGHYRLFYIRDNGVGFNMKYSRKIFGVFQRLHHPDEFEGSGIGLANVQRIVMRHGGRCGVRSRENRGTLFYFTLPAVSPANQPMRLAEEA